MTQPAAPPVRIPLPAVATAAYVVAPLLMIVCALFVLGAGDAGHEWAVRNRLLGTVGFWFGALMLVVALVLSGVRSIAQWHLEAVTGRR